MVNLLTSLAMKHFDTYASATEFLFTQIPAFHREGAGAYKPGLERTLALSAAFGNPHKKVKTIHVGGTNGKGSVSSTLAAILQTSGRRTGLFTSPHLVDFRERIRIDGAMISEEEVVDFVNRYLEMDLGIEPSFFELTTVMALEHFAKNRVDIAVIEVGLGGRLDSTNIIDPLMCVITNISLEHTALLGDTLEKIASEKAGIIKPGKPVVAGRSEGSVREVFAAKSLAEGATIRFADSEGEIESWTDTGLTNRYTTLHHGTLEGELTGSCQAENMATILCAVDTLRELGIELTDKHISEGIANVGRKTGLFGRWTVISREPKIVCDTGHNPGCWEHICNHLSDTHGRKIALVGFVGDKDVDTILAMIAKLQDIDLILTQPSVERQLPVEDLHTAAKRHGLNVVGVSETVADGYKKAIAAADAASDGPMVFVGGSTFVVSDLLTFLSEQR